METLVAPSINLAILIAALVYYLRAPLRQFVQTRHHSLREEVHNVRERLASAQARFREFSSRLGAMESEITQLREQMKQDAESARRRVLDDARKASTNVVADARSGAQNLFSELKGELYGELGSKVIGRAESILRDRLTGDDHARIRKEFSSQVGASG